VDITSLSPPDGQYLAAIRNAITLMSVEPSPPEVRIISAEIPVEGTVNTKTLLESFTRDVASFLEDSRRGRPPTGRATRASRGTTRR